MGENLEHTHAYRVHVQRDRSRLEPQWRVRCAMSCSFRSSVTSLVASRSISRRGGASLTGTSLFVREPTADVLALRELASGVYVLEIRCARGGLTPPRVPKNEYVPPPCDLYSSVRGFLGLECERDASSEITKLPDRVRLSWMKRVRLLYFRA